MPEVLSYNPEDETKLDEGTEVEESENPPDEAGVDSVPADETVEAEHSPDYQQLQAKLAELDDKASLALVKAIGVTAVGVVSGLAAFYPGVAVSLLASSMAGRKFRAIKSEADSLRQTLSARESQNADITEEQPSVGQKEEQSGVEQNEEVGQKIAQFLDDCCPPGTRGLYNVKINSDGTAKLEWKSYDSGPLKIEKPFSESETIPPEITEIDHLVIGEGIHEFRASNLIEVDEIMGGQNLSVFDSPQLQSVNLFKLQGPVAINCPNLSSIVKLKISKFNFRDSRFGSLEKIRESIGVNGFSAGLATRMFGIGKYHLPDRIRDYLNSLGTNNPNPKSISLARGEDVPNPASISPVGGNSRQADGDLSMVEPEDKT